jgi:RecA/RadA recombinase
MSPEGTNSTTCGAIKTRFLASGQGRMTGHPSTHPAVSAALAARLGSGGARKQHVRPAQPAQPPAFETGVPFLDGALVAGALVDVVGPSRSGKTALLHRVAAHALVAVGVVWVDLNGGLDLDLLARSTAAPDTTTSEALLPPDPNAVMKGRLSRLHVYKPESSLALLCTLHSLHNFLESKLGSRGMFSLKARTTTNSSPSG